jgi:tetratricopeptide (TPR) repeat protein
MSQNTAGAGGIEVANRRWKLWWYALGPAIVAAALFCRVCGFDFVNNDDYAYVAANPHVQTGLTAANVWWALTHSHSANWHPLTWWSLQLDSSLLGTQPAGYHATNLVLHVANTLLVFWVWRTISGANVRAVAVAALFAIHPAHVESVAWVSERKDVLSTSFWMLTLLVYARYAARPSAGRYAAVQLTFALGLMAKTMLVTLPCVLLLLDYWPLRRWPGTSGRQDSAKRGTPSADRDVSKARRPVVGTRSFRAGRSALRASPPPRSALRAPPSVARLIAEKVPMLLLSFACSLIALASQSKGGTIASIDRLPFIERLGNAISAYVAYLKMAVWPANLAAFYPREQIRQPLGVVVLEAAALLAVSFWVYRRRKRQGYLLVGWFWFLGTLVPVIGLVQVGPQAIADRYTYVPHIGLFLAIVWYLADVAANRLVSGRLLTGLAIGLAALGFCTWRQVGYWRDSVTLWRHALEVTGPNLHTCVRLGKALVDRGQSDEALPYLQRAVEFSPGDAEVRAFLGLALFNLGDLVQCRREYEEVLRISPGFAAAHRMLGAVAQLEHEPARAADHLRDALRIDPNDWQAHWGLGELLIGQGAHDEGRRHLREASRLNPQLSRGAAEMTNEP